MSKDHRAGVAFALSSLVTAPLVLIGGLIASPFVLASSAFSHHSSGHSSYGSSSSSHFGFARSNNTYYGSNEFSTYVPTNHFNPFYCR